MEAQNTSKNSVSRRDFMKVAGAAAASGLLATHLSAFTGRSTARAQAEAEVSFMIHGGELSEEEIQVFHDENPGITLTRLDVDQTTLFARMAAGDAPDIWRLQYPEFPQLLARNLVLNLQSFFEASALLKLDDLVEPNNFYKATDAFNIGEGPIYGMIKDWSPDMTVFVNDGLFEAAGVDPVPQDAPLSYQEYADLAAQVTQTEGERVNVVGYFFNQGWIDRYWAAWLIPLGQGLFSEDFRTANIVNNEEARAMVKWHLDMAQDKVAFSPLVQSSAWAGPDFINQSVAMVQFGYWFSAFLRINALNVTGDDLTPAIESFQELMDSGKIRMVPAPSWGGEWSSPTITATAAVIYRETANPDEAFRVFEYYNAELPAINRADLGWGIPALRSMFDRLPKDGTYGQLMWNALENELPHTGTIIPANPYLPGGEPGAMGQAFLGKWEEYLNGNLSFDDLLVQIEEDTNDIIETNAFDMGM